MSKPGKIKVARFMSGRTAADLAREVGISATHLCNVESGRKGASLDTIIRIARALGVRVDDLLTEGET